MAGISNALKVALLDHVLRTTPYTPPATVYVRLYRAMPGDDGVGGTEITGTGYAPVGIATEDANWTAPALLSGTQYVSSNAAAVDFGTAGSDWAPQGSEMVGFGLWTAATGGTYLGGNTFAAQGGQPAVVQSGNLVRFAAGELDFILAGS